MKTFKLILAAILIAFVSVAQAQKTFKASDVIEGKSISRWAKEWDLKAFQDTKELYKPGMSQEAFILAIRRGFPTLTTESLKDVFVTYYEYIYKFHSAGKTDTQVVNAVTGNEAAVLCTNLSSWNANNPGQLIEAKKWDWKKIIGVVVDILIVIAKIL